LALVERVKFNKNPRLATAVGFCLIRATGHNQNMKVDYWMNGCMDKWENAPQRRPINPPIHQSINPKKRHEQDN
jgi:hypothetical protein